MTLIELVIVIIVLGIIAAVAAPKFANIATDATTSAVAGSQGAFASSYTIAVARYQNAQTAAQVAAQSQGFTWNATDSAGTIDVNNDAVTDLTVNLFTDSTCATAVTATTDVVAGYDFSGVCQTN